MKVHFLALATLAAVAFALAGFAADDEDGVQVQARGPVHEAFAEAGDALALTPVLAPKAPPDPIEEAPPEERPEGDNVLWVPGYWAWDEVEADFLWISGAWRTVPPGRSWVPGHWQKVRDGHRWVAGYWSDDRDEEVEYLPEPPETLERGPSAPAPSEEHAYVPGVWVYQTKYVWRPGYWVKYRPGWVWVPDCYKWSPAGYVFVPGYWDAPLCDRGLLFAPVRIARTAYLRRGFVYRPAYVVQPDFLVGSLFVRRQTRTYYFGDYFEPKLRTRFVPWFEHRPARNAFDVNYTYYRRAFARQAGWERGVKALYEARYDGGVARPPRTLVQQTRVVEKFRTNRTADRVVSKTVNITNVQNVTAVAPVRRAESFRVTALANLGGDRDRKAPAARTVRVIKVREEIIKEERRQAERSRMIAQQRRLAETRAAAKLPDNGRLKAPVKVRIEVPKNAPPRRVLKAPTPPPPPVRIKEPAPRKDREKDVTPPPKDKNVPPKDRNTKDRRPKDKDKADRDRDLPPRKDGKAPPVRDKDKADRDKGRDKSTQPRDGNEPPIRDKDKAKDKTPPPPKDREKEKADRDKGRDKNAPPKDKEKEKDRGKDKKQPDRKGKDRGKEKDKDEKDKDRPGKNRPG